MPKAHLTYRKRFVIHSPFKVSGRFVCRVRDKETGHVHKLSTGETQRRKAIEWMQEWCDERLPRSESLRSSSFAHAFQEWMELQSWRPSTRRDYRACFDARIEPFFRTHTVTSVKALDVERFISELEKKHGNAGKTRRKYLAFLRTFYSWALRHEFCEKDPTAGIRMPKSSKRSGYALTVEEARTLLEACSRPTVRTVHNHRRGSWQQTFTPPPHLRTAVAIALYTGLRRSNVCGLRWGQVDLAKRRIRIPAEEMKANQDFTVPLHRDLVELLRGCQSIDGRQARVPRADDPVLGKLQAITKSFKSALVRADLPDIRWHDLRHTYGTWLKSRCTFDVLRSLMGHAGVESGPVTLRYTHVTEEERLTAIDSLPGFLERADDTTCGQAQAVSGGSQDRLWR